MRHPQRLLLTLAALITVSSCKSEAPKPPPPKVQAVSTQLAEFTEGVDTVSTLEASNLVELAAQSGGRIEELKISQGDDCLLYTSPSPRDATLSRMPSSA